VYKVGFIREIGKATAREVQWSLEISLYPAQVKAGVFMDVLTLGGCGGDFSLVMDFMGFLR
jgi:hypothetical protein